MGRGTDAGVDGEQALWRCPSGGLSYCSLDIHRRCRHPELDLAPGRPFKARPPQPVQFLGETEGAFDADLALPQPPPPERAGDPFSRRLNQVLHELAMERA